MVPRVSYDTVMLAVRYVPAPIAGMVFTGTGAVCEMPTRGIPMPNATYRHIGSVFHYIQSHVTQYSHSIPINIYSTQNSHKLIIFADAYQTNILHATKYSEQGIIQHFQLPTHLLKHQQPRSH